MHVRAQFDKTYELVMTPPQAVIVSLFNDTPKLRYTDIQELTKIPGEDLDRLLASLTFAKHKLLVKSPASKSINQSDTFAVNEKFTDRMRRIKVEVTVLNL